MGGTAAPTALQIASAILDLARKHTTNRDLITSALTLALQMHKDDRFNGPTILAHDGSQPCQLGWANQRAKPEGLPFRSNQDALQWLNRLRAQRSDFFIAARNLLAYNPPARGMRFTDQQLLEEMARLLMAGQLAAVRMEIKSMGRSAPAVQSAKPVPFPLAAAPPKSASASPAPAAAPPTFSPNVSASAQAAALVAAANSGAPFCPE